MRALAVTRDNKNVTATQRRIADWRYLHARDMRVAASLTTLGIVGIVMSDASMEIAVPYLRFMVVGGAFLTPGLMDHRGESVVVASVPQRGLSPQDLAPQAHERPSVLPSPIAISRRVSVTFSNP